jgi:hypothetical protein
MLSSPQIRTACGLAVGVAVLLGSIAWAAQAQPEPKSDDKSAQQAPKEKAPSAPAAPQKNDSPQPADKKADAPRDANPQPPKDKDADKPPRDANNDKPKTQDKDDKPAKDDKPRAQDKDDKPAKDDKPRTDPRSEDRDAPRDRDAARDRDTARDREDAKTRDTDRTRDRADDARRPSDSDRADKSRRDRDRKHATAEDLGFSFSRETSERGLRVSQIRGVAAKAKFRQGDIIISVNDHRIRTHDDFIRWIHVDTRERITVIVLRDDEEVTLYLEPEWIYSEVAVDRGGAWLGVDLVDRFKEQAVVLKVYPNSPAARAGLEGEDMILSVDGVEITSPEHLGKVIGSMSPGDLVEIEIDRNRRVLTVDARLGQRENVARRTEILTPPPPPTNRDTQPMPVPRRTPLLPRR